MEKFTPLATNFTLPPGLTGWTNFTSGGGVRENKILFSGKMIAQVQDVHVL